MTTFGAARYARLAQLIRRRERGSALIEFVFIGVGLLVPLIWIMLTLFSVQKAAYAASAASRAGGRAYVLAGADGRDADAAMRSAVQMALDDQNVGDDARAPELTCAGGCLQPGSTATVRVVIDVHLPMPDFLSGAINKTVTVHSSHTTPYGDYRSAS